MSRGCDARPEDSNDHYDDDSDESAKALSDIQATFRCQETQD